MTLQPSRRLYATLVALVFAMATALVVLLAYLVAELYLSNKGWLVELPDGRELAHLRMRNLLLLVGLPAMAAIGFAVGWYGHAPATAPADATAAPTTALEAGAEGCGSRPEAPVDAHSGTQCVAAGERRSPGA